MFLLCDAGKKQRDSRTTWTNKAVVSATRQHATPVSAASIDSPSGTKHAVAEFSMSILAVPDPWNPSVADERGINIKPTVIPKQD
jgi:hypothetical protein